LRYQRRQPRPGIAGPGLACVDLFDPAILAQIGASSKGEVCRAKDATPAVIQALRLDQFCSDLRYADSAAQIFSMPWIMTDTSVLSVCSSGA